MSADAVGLPPAAASTSGAPAHPTAADAEPRKDDKVDEPKKKRGFWGRIFGRGDEEKAERKKAEDEERKKEEERKKAERRPGGR